MKYITALEKAKYITIVYLLVTFSGCKQETPDVKKDPEMQRFGEDQFKKLSSLKKLSATTMIDYFGEPPRTIEILHAMHYLYVESDEVGYIFEIEGGGSDLINKDTDQIVILAIRKYPGFDMIWQSSDYQEKLKQRSMQAELGLTEEQLKKLSSLKKLSAKAMVEYFGEPINFGESYDDSHPDPFGDKHDDPFAELKSPNLTKYIYYAQNEGMYIFEVKKGTHSSKNLKQVVILSVIRQPEGKVIWRAQEELKKPRLEDK